jgi:hypothetical protein
MNSPKPTAMPAMPASGHVRVETLDQPARDPLQRPGEQEDDRDARRLGHRRLGGPEVERGQQVAHR